MPAASSCASGRHSPPESSASCAYTRSPPYTGLVVSLLDAEPVVFDLLLLHAPASSNKMTRSAPVRRAVRREEVETSTFPPLIVRRRGYGPNDGRGRHRAHDGLDGVRRRRSRPAREHPVEVRRAQ